MWLKWIKICLLVLLLALPGGTAGAAAVVGEVDTRGAAQRYADAQQTLLAAAACWSSYYHGAGMVDYLRAAGWELEFVDAKGEYAATHFMLGRKAGQPVLVAIRGSADIADWKNNLATSQVPFGGATHAQSLLLRGKELPATYPKVHKGFNDYADVMLGQLVQRGVVRQLRQDTKTRLLLTGHSLGGAVATLLAERLVLLGVPKDRMQVVSFGAPAVANQAFVAQYGDAIRLLRVTTSADPIPGSLQTLRGGYQQFGLHVHYKLSPRDNAMQHYMDLYLDRAADDYYRQYQAAVAEGEVQALPERQERQADFPLVAVYVSADQRLSQRPYMPQLRWFAERALSRALPNYVLLQELPDEARDKPVRNAVEAAQDHVLGGDLGALLPLARAAGARYAVALRLGTYEPQDKRSWYLSAETSLWDVQTGRMQHFATLSRNLGYYSGNLDLTAEALVAVKDAMERCWGFPKAREASSPQ